MKSYGITNFNVVESKFDFHLENIKRRGYSIEPNILTTEKCDYYIGLINKVYKKQESEFGKENLRKINELDMARMPFMDESELAKLFLDPFISQLVKGVIGDAVQLHLQNAIINRPSREHHQSSWHRDLPYQEWTITKPLAVNAFFCLTDFTEANGATYLLPYSHKFDSFPSVDFAEENKIVVSAPKGSVLFFDSMVYHRAGYNQSNSVRIGINNMFVVPILKPQINFDIKTFIYSNEVSEALGKSFETPNSVLDFRNKRLNKI